MEKLNPEEISLVATNAILVCIIIMCVYSIFNTIDTRISRLEHSISYSQAK